MSNSELNRVLLIDDNTIAQAKQVMAYAIKHRETIRQIQDRESTNAPGPADDPKHALLIPCGYRVVYSVEQHPVDGWCSHVSIAVDNPSAWPSPKAAQEILKHCFNISWSPTARPPLEKDRWEARVRISGQMINLVNFRFALNLTAA